MKNAIDKSGKVFNKEWHLKNPMPKNATTEQRIQWHIAHHENCNCRDIPDSIKKELKNRKIRI